MREVFIDSSAFFASFVTKDRFHQVARSAFLDLRTQQRRSITTDHVVAETLTLLRVRGYNHLCKVFHDYVYGSRIHDVIHTSQERFSDSAAFFLKYSDKGYSFTDCISFVVMREKKLTDALTTDDHFNQAGFRALLAVG